MYVSGQALKEMSKILVQYSNNRRLSNISIARLMKTYVAPHFRKTLAFQESLCNLFLQMLYYFWKLSVDFDSKCVILISIYITHIHLNI